MLKNGHFDETSGAFVQFKRQNIIKWGAISQIMQKIERWISQYNITYCYIDVAGLVALADNENEIVTEKDLMSIVTNKTQVIEQTQNPLFKFKGPNGPVLATIKIQTAWRRHKAFSAFQQLKFLMAKATIIQRKFRLFQLKKSTKVKVNQINQEAMTVWREMQSEFKRCWPEIKRTKRVEIHINSFSISCLKRMSISKLKQKENS